MERTKLAKVIKRIGMAMLLIIWMGKGGECRFQPESLIAKTSFYNSSFDFILLALFLLAIFMLLFSARISRVLSNRMMSF